MCADALRRKSAAAVYCSVPSRLKKRHTGSEVNTRRGAGRGALAMTRPVVVRKVGGVRSTGASNRISSCSDVCSSAATAAACGMWEQEGRERQVRLCGDLSERLEDGEVAKGAACRQGAGEESTRRRAGSLSARLPSRRTAEDMAQPQHRAPPPRLVPMSGLKASSTTVTWRRRRLVVFER